jgi:hypothetical protein
VAPYIKRAWRNVPDQAHFTGGIAREGSIHRLAPESGYIPYVTSTWDRKGFKKRTPGEPEERSGSPPLPLASCGEGRLTHTHNTTENSPFPPLRKSPMVATVYPMARPRRKGNADARVADFSCMLRAASKAFLRPTPADHRAPYSADAVQRHQALRMSLASPQVEPLTYRSLCRRSSRSNIARFAAGRAARMSLAFP